MDRVTRACLLFMAFVLGAWVLYWMRDILAPFALAVFFWLIIDAFAKWMSEKMSFLPYMATLGIAFSVVIASMVGIGLIIADTAFDVAANANDYEHRLGEIINPVIERFGDGSWDGLNERFGISSRLEALLGGFARSVQGVMSSFVFIALYVVFLFAAQNSFGKKMHDFWPDPEKRKQAARVGERIRVSIEKYLGIQTLMSIIMTVLSFAIMKMFGLDNALFWALVIFILNYIPVVGSVLAGILPAMFALVQFDTLLPVGIMAGLLFFVQFIISNTVQPKMMGDSMNLSALVVILSLVLWQAMWGGVGAFLSAPLTVILMIILAQFSTTRWIAVMLSADGDPDLKEKKVTASM
ncbi:MAG: AI-2E family transporter [Robiginitomaculum sp.]|nr:AI-2E family transporter [Robiginitomaculum sp.]